MILNVKNVRISPAGTVWQDSSIVPVTQLSLKTIPHVLDVMTAASPAPADRLLTGSNLNIQLNSPDDLRDTLIQKALYDIRFVTGPSEWMWILTGMEYKGGLLIGEDEICEFAGMDFSRLHIIPIGDQVPAPVILNLQDGQVFIGTVITINGTA